MSDLGMARAALSSAANYAAGHPGHDTEALEAARRVAYLTATQDRMENDNEY